jgi:hypothetical protein
LQTFQSIIFGLAFPVALRLNGRSVLSSLALILHTLGRVDHNLRELVVLAQVLQVIAPESGLRLEVQRL